MRSIVAVAATALCAALGGVALLALQEGPPPAATAPAAPPPLLPLVTAQDLLDGLKHPGRWLTYSGDYTGRRHSPLKQITPDNVARLAAQWTFQAEGMVIGPRLRGHAAGDGRRALHHRQQQHGLGDRRAHRPPAVALSPAAAARR